MKKTYIQPEMLAVELQHSQIVAASKDTYDTSGNSGLTDEGSSDGYQGPDGGAAKGSVNVWDEEW